jgi:hypothetical protein
MTVPEDWKAVIAGIRRETPREWWWWHVSPSPRVRMMSFNLPWPYLRPEHVPGPWWVHDLPRKRVLSALESEFAQLPGTDWPRRDNQPNVEWSDRSLGRMLAIQLEWWGRGGPYRRLLTPPVYKFCDLDKGYPDAPSILMPFDFWIQPDVFHETGEILQGSVIHESNLQRGINRPALLASILREGSPWQEMVEYIHVALDAFLERGDNTPDPRFVFSFAEQRERKYGL